MQNKFFLPRLEKFVQKRLGQAGFNQNSVAFCEHNGLLCLGDREGNLYMISASRFHQVKKITLKYGIDTLKYVKHEKALYIACVRDVHKFSFRKNRITSVKSLDFRVRLIEYVDTHDVIAVAGDSFGVRFYNLALVYQFSINYSDSFRIIHSMIYLEKPSILIIGLDTGGLIAYDMRTTRLLDSNYKQKSAPNYLKHIEGEDMILSGGQEGRIYIRMINKSEGFKAIDCLWMKKSEILGMVPLKRGEYFACLHSGMDSLSIVRTKDWQLVKSVPIFFNTTGGTNLVSMLGGKMLIATEKAEGFYYLIKSKI